MNSDLRLPETVTGTFQLRSTAGVPARLFGIDPVKSRSGMPNSPLYFSRAIRRAECGPQPSTQLLAMGQSVKNPGVSQRTVVNKQAWHSPNTIHDNRKGEVYEHQLVRHSYSPQNEVLSEQGGAWKLVRDSVIENKTVEHMERIFQTAKQTGFEVFISPDYYFPTDNSWPPKTIQPQPIGS